MSRFDEDEKVTVTRKQLAEAQGKAIAAFIDEFPEAFIIHEEFCKVAAITAEIIFKEARHEQERMGKTHYRRS